MNLSGQKLPDPGHGSSLQKLEMLKLRNYAYM